MIGGVPKSLPAVTFEGGEEGKHSHETKGGQVSQALFEERQHQIVVHAPTTIYLMSCEVQRLEHSIFQGFF